MSSLSGHLIVVSPRVGQFWKAQFTRTHLIILALAFLVSFLSVVVIGYTFPPIVSEVDRVRLESENQALRIETKDAGFRMRRLTTRVSRIEVMSARVVDALGD